MAFTDPAGPAGVRDDRDVSVAAQLCWHSFRICQAVAASLDRLQADLAEISTHCGALIEMALDLDRHRAKDDTSCRGDRR